MPAVRVCLAFVAAATLSGCANMLEVRSFAKASADTAGFLKLTDEYVTGPERRERYLLPEEANVRPKLEAEAKTRLAQKPKLVAMHKAVADYMNALGDLAADELTAYDQQLGPLVDAASADNLVSEGDVDALKSISVLLANAAAELYRQKQIKQVIERANGPLGTLLDSLDKRIVRSYAGSIEDEEIVFTSYYQWLDSTAVDNREVVAGQLVRGIVAETQPTFERRRAAANEYAANLRTIKEAHQKLYEHRADLTNDQFLATVKSYAEKVNETMKNVRAAFGQ